MVHTARRQIPFAHREKTQAMPSDAPPFPGGIGRVLLCLACLAAAPSASAGPADKIYTPKVEKGETGIEFRSGYRIFGDSRDAIAYDAAVLAGLNAAAPDAMLRFEIEYEIY